MPTIIPNLGSENVARCSPSLESLFGQEGPDIIIMFNYVSTTLIISILSCIVISEQLERGCNLTDSPFYYCCICHFISLQDCSGVKEVVSAAWYIVHILRFDLTNSVKLWLLFITTIMTTPSQDLDVALA